MNFLSDITVIWQKTTLMQRAMLVAVVMACGISAVMLTKWAKTPNMRLLYQDVAAEEAAKITEKISEKGIAYELRGGGTSIYVPQENVYQLRLDLARDGLPSGDQGGYKLFDDEKIGISPFVQGVNLNRALQDELAKTIQMIDGVVYARVHLVRPEQALFGSSDSRTSASVVLRLKSGVALSETNIAAITHLVASSVEGLKFENVTVVDSTGKLFSKARDETLAAGASTSLEYKERVEQTLAKKAQDMLTHVLGHGRATVSVSAVVNMTISSHTKETYDPTSKIATKEEIKNKSEVGAVPAASQNQTTPAAGPTTKDETINTEYVVGKIVEQKTEMPGEIMSLAVSAIVDLSPAQSADANANAVAAPVMTVKDVEEIIKNAVGLKSTDSLKVVNAKFNHPAPVANVEEEYRQNVKWNRYIEIARHSSLGILAISALLVLKMFGGARKRMDTAMPALGAMPAGASAGLLNAGQYTEEPTMLRAQIAGALERNPEEVKRLFSNWVNEKGE
jgi:flagellar M-ring protein FliF